MTDVKPDRTTVAMAGALASIANGASPQAAAEAAGVSLDATYKAMRRYGIGTRDRERCPNCKRLMPGRVA